MVEPIEGSPRPASTASIVQSWRDRLARRSGGGSFPALTVVLGVLVGVAVALATAVVVGGTMNGASPMQALPLAVRVTTTTTPPPPATVHVAGAVTQPGVVALADGSRIVDALEAAGGARPDADLARLNLAEIVMDGSRIYVPVAGEQPPPALSPTGGNGSGGGSAGGASPGAPLNLNAATAGELDTLPGVGPSTAAAIVAHRDANGPFAAVEDLLAVRGIGPAKLEAIRVLVAV